METVPIRSGSQKESIIINPPTLKYFHERRCQARDDVSTPAGSVFTPPRTARVPITGSIHTSHTACISTPWSQRLNLIIQHHLPFCTSTPVTPLPSPGGLLSPKSDWNLPASSSSATSRPDACSIASFAWTQQSEWCTQPWNPGMVRS